MNRENVWQNLAYATIEQAASDWRELCNEIGKPENPFKPREKRTFSFASLRKFFKSDWCAVLCGNVNPSYILHKLEAERKIALKTTKGGNQ